MKKVYLAVLTPVDTGYVVYVPDLQINTEGKDLSDAIYMARDAIGLWSLAQEDLGNPIPAPSKRLPNPAGNEIATLVDINLDAYRRANDSRTVRKNLTLPSWLNELAERSHVNFSQVLQAALKDYLGVDNR